MKRLMILFVFYFLHLPVFAQNISLETLRKEYYKVNTDSASCAKLYDLISQTKSNDNLINGYKGAITAAMANHKNNKREKLSLFISGKKLLEASIKADSSNIELRFLRFTIQSNCPKQLGYQDQLASDKSFIISKFPSIKNNVLKNEMGAFIFQSKFFNEAERNKIKSYMNK